MNDYKNSLTQQIHCVEEWQAPACQPYGAALVIDSDGTIITITTSTSDLLGAPSPELLLGENLFDVCSPLYDVWQDRVEGILDPRDWTNVQWSNTAFDARAVPFEDVWLIDAWPAGEEEHGWNDVQNVTALVRDWLQQKKFDLNSALEKYCEWLNVDAALIYQIEESGEGHIVAQNQSSKHTNLIGLHYPLSQLGTYAQALGLQNVARNIVNIDLPSTKWMTIRPELDPSLAELSVCRDTDLNHARLMRKFGFVSSLMLPIIMDGRVRGLLLAYSQKPKVLSGVTLLVARTFVQSLALKINAQDLRNRFEYTNALTNAQLQIEKFLTSHHNLKDLIDIHPQLLLAATNAQGVIYYQDESQNTWSHGLAISSAETQLNFVKELNKHIPDNIDAYGAGMYISDIVKLIYPRITEVAHGLAGVAALRLPNKDMLVFTRKEHVIYIDDNERPGWTNKNHVRVLQGYASSWNTKELGIIRDIAQLIIQTQRENQKSNSAIQMEYEAAITYGRDGRVLYLNKPTRTLLKHNGLLTNRNELSIYDIFNYGSNEHQNIQRAMEHAYHQGSWTGELTIAPNTYNLAHTVSIWGTLRSIREDGQVYFTWTGKDITARKYAEEESLYLQESQPLANVIAPDEFRNVLTQSIERVQSKQGDATTFGCLLTVDLDNTKGLIAAMGETVASGLFELLHQRLLRDLGTTVQVAHLGIDEFSIFVENLENDDQIWSLAERVRKIIYRAVPVNERDVHHFTCGIGIALYPYHAANVSDLLSAVDDAMYIAKRAGRGQIRMHDSSANISGSHKYHLAGELRRAIQNNELRAYLQPQFNAKTKQLIGAEALVRWQHPEKGLVPPGQFISIAEETGLIDKLGEWVLRDTLRQISTWPDQWRNQLKVSVNASVRQLRDREYFLNMIKSALVEHNVPASALEIEITESIWMGNNENAIETLQSLREEGISIAIDDFGTGYSNIAYLQSFPLDKLKFDRSFVVSGVEKEKGKAILKAMVQLADALNVTTLAEGVETMEQEKMLLDVGVENVQGFAYGRPIPEEQFIQLLHSIKKE